MSFPKNNFFIIFSDICTPEETCPLLYLSIDKNEAIAKCLKEKNEKYFIKLFNLPSKLRKLLISLFSKPVKNYAFLLPSFIDSDELNKTSLCTLKKLIESCTKNNSARMALAIAVLKETNKEWTESHPIFGKYLFLTAFLLQHSISEKTFLNQARCL